MHASSSLRPLSLSSLGLGICIGSMRSVCSNTLRTKDGDEIGLLIERPRQSMTDYVRELRIRDYWMKELNGELDAPTPYWKGRVKHHEKVYEPNPTNSAKPRSPFKKRKP